MSIDKGFLEIEIGLKTLYLVEICCAIILIPVLVSSTMLLNQLLMGLANSCRWHMRLLMFEVALRPSFSIDTAIGIGDNVVQSKCRLEA